MLHWQYQVQSAKLTMVSKSRIICFHGPMFGEGAGVQNRCALESGLLPVKVQRDALHEGQVQGQGSARGREPGFPVLSPGQRGRPRLRAGRRRRLAPIHSLKRVHLHNVDPTSFKPKIWTPL